MSFLYLLYPHPPLSLTLFYLSFFFCQLSFETHPHHLSHPYPSFSHSDMEDNPAVTFKHDRSLMYNKRPKVLVVGAGLGGMTLGTLLHKAGIPFDIYERASEVKPLGK